MAASNAGGPKHPAWFHNLRADAHVSVEIGTAEGAVEHFRATAVVIEGEERDRLYAEQCERDPAFSAYQAGTDRIIPVVALHRLDLTDPARLRAVADHLVTVHAELRAEAAFRLRGCPVAPGTGPAVPLKRAAEGPVRTGRAWVVAGRYGNARHMTTR
ncbi:nitroreductase/quinone reductase family protein [Streptomyces sp. NPDC006482]|uniref:nitroreductase/quinone reductase family protein n=1 Tax=Streptomyces sp. NPDC006482 TaxID=3154306 RepID=UPI0033A579B8